MYSDGGAANDLAVLLNKAQYSLREEAVVEGDDALRLRWPVSARLTTILMPRGRPCQAIRSSGRRPDCALVFLKRS
jgi:hypothetical protein